MLEVVLALRPFDDAKDAVEGALGVQRRLAEGDDGREQGEADGEPEPVPGEERSAAAPAARIPLVTTPPGSGVSSPQDDAAMAAIVHTKTRNGSRKSAVHAKRNVQRLERAAGVGRSASTSASGYSSTESKSWGASRR